MIAGHPHAQSFQVERRHVATDSEGYLFDRSQWSGEFARQLAQHEGLESIPAHREIIHYLRDYYAEHRIQAQVRVMIRHYIALCGPKRSPNRHLHEMFPRGGPQKQGSRLAGLLRTG